MGDERTPGSLPDSGYWLYAKGVALPPGDSAWGRCENCVAQAGPCFSCTVRVQPGDPPLDKSGISVPVSGPVESTSDAGYAYGEGYKAGARESARMPVPSGPGGEPPDIRYDTENDEAHITISNAGQLAAVEAELDFFLLPESVQIKLRAIAEQRDGLAARVKALEAASPAPGGPSEERGE